MATALKTPPAGMTGAVRSLQWTIQDLNGSVEHLAQSHDVLRRAQNIMAWTTAIFGVLLLSGLVWIANDIFHLKDQMMETDRRFDGMEAQMNALGTRLDDLNLTIEQVGAELLASRGPAAQAATGPQVSVLSTPTGSANLEAAAAPLETTAPDAAAQPQPVNPAPQAPATVAAAPAPALATAPAAPAAATPAQPAAPAQAVAAAAPAVVVPAVAPSPPAPRDQLTPEELAQQSPVIIAAVPAAAPAAPAAAAQPADSAAAATAVAAAPAEEAPAPAPAAQPAAPAAAAPAADLSDDQLLSYNDDQIDPADELLLLDENGNPQ